MDTTTGYNEHEVQMLEIINSIKFHGLPIPVRGQEPIRTSWKTVHSDFLVMRRIVIECDGEVHNKGKQPMKDERRDEELRKLGYVILRFTNEEIETMPKACAAKILAEIMKLPVEVVNEAYLPAGTYPARAW